MVGVFDAAQTRLNHGEAGLHEHDQEARDQRPHKVDGDLVLAHLVGDVAQREARLGVATGTSLTVPVMVPPGSPLARVAVVGAFDRASFNSAADAEGAASARATVAAPAVSKIARAQVQVAMRAILIRFRSMSGLIDR